MNFVVIKLTLLVVVCSHLADCTAPVDPEILEGPVTQVVPITQTEAQFTCHARGTAVFWIIDNEVLDEQLPPCVTMKYDDHDIVATKVRKTIGIKVTQECNGTEVVCSASTDNSGSVQSSPAFLYVAVAPSQPDSTLTTLNKTALRASWNESNSRNEFPVLSYTLNIQNLTSSSLIDTVVLSDTNASSFQYVFTVDSALSECHNISVEVTANNSVGGSSPGVATGGFPIALGDFLISPTVEVTFTADLRPRVKISFTYPSICWYQSGTYKIQILNAMGNVEMSVGPNLHMGQENPRITEVFPTGLSMDQVYKVVVTTNSFGQSVQEEKVFNTSFNTLESTSATSINTPESTSGSADVGVIGVTAGFCVVLVLVLAISISVFIIVHIQKLNKKVREPTAIPPPDVLNPIYESADPVYEEISREKCPNSPVKSSAQRSSCSEYVSMEGGVNGDSDRYEKLHTSDKMLTNITSGIPNSAPAEEDNYTFMSSAGAVCLSKEQLEHNNSLPRNIDGSQVHANKTCSQSTSHW